MLVVCNTSPLINLATIGQGELLCLLYGRVLIAPAVQREFRDLRRDQRFAAAVLPECVVEQPLSASAVLHLQTLAPLLDPGEAETLALAASMHADLVLIDERAGYKMARDLGLRPLGLVGVLLEGKARGFLCAVAPHLDRLESEAGFWLSAHVRRLALDAAGE